MSGRAASRRSTLLLGIGVVLGSLLLFLAVRQVDWRAVADALGRISPAWLLAGAVTSIAAHALMAARWYAIVGRAHGISFGDAFDFVAIATVSGLVVSPRLGDVARAVVAGRYHATSSTNLFGTIVIERLLDVVALVLFGFSVAVLMDVAAPLLSGLAVLLAIALAAVVVLWIGERGPIGIVTRWAMRVRGPQTRLAGLAERFLAGTGVIRDQRIIPVAFLITVVGWATAAVSAGLLVRASSASTPWFAGVFVLVVINLAGILPAPPSGVGVYHYAAMVSVSPWITDDSAAFAFALVCHATSVAVALTIGTVGLARKGLSIRSLRRMTAQQSQVQE